MLPISVESSGNYTRNVGHKTGSITYEFETTTLKYDRGIKLLADVMDVEEAGVLNFELPPGALNGVGSLLKLMVGGRRLTFFH